MKEQKLIINRIKYFCKTSDLSYYALSYQSAVPLTTLLHILDGSTKNPGIFTIAKICDGLQITLKEFFDSEEFQDIDYWK